MIHSTMLMRTKSQRKIASTQYWKSDIPRSDILEYLAIREDRKQNSPRSVNRPAKIGGYRYFGRECSDKILIIFITCTRIKEREMNKRINTAVEKLQGLLKKKSLAYVKKNYEAIISPIVLSRFILAFVGEMGVGKTTLSHLLRGLPPLKDHIPTITFNIEVIENVRLANYELVIWDFAGHQQSEKIMELKGADIVFLLTDSTLTNILISKEMLSRIKHDHPKLSTVVISNKQDLPNALTESTVAKVMENETYPMVAIDLAYRPALLEILIKVTTRHFGLCVPNVPPEELLMLKEN